MWRSSGLTVEVYSETWRHTIEKTLINVINHLRVLRAFDPSIQSCVGFAFPGLHSPQAACVAQVTVTLDHFMFKYRIEYLQQGDAKETIKQYLTTQNRRWLPGDFSYFIRLTQQECNQFRPNSVQVKSQGSILLFQNHANPTERKYWKNSIEEPSKRFTEITAVNIYCARTGRNRQNSTIVQHSLLPEDCVLWPPSNPMLEFHKYKGLGRPLTRQEVKPHLLFVLEGVHLALDELHNEPHHLAHLDVRLENICYTHPPNAQVKLIDLERCSDSYAPTKVSVEFSKSDMYTPLNSSWKNYQLDWKCVGLIICFVLDENVHPEDYHQMISGGFTSIPSQYPFVRSLLQHGEWSDTDWNTFKTNFPSSSSSQPLLLC